MAPLIRPADTSDAARLGEVHVAAWQWAYRGLMPDEVLDSLRPDARARAWEHMLGERDSGFQAWVAEVDGEVIGFASSGAPLDDDLPEGSVELMAIYLLEPYLHTGIGSQLIEAAESAWVDQGSQLGVLWVLEDNTGTIEFYERHGWYHDGSRRDHQVAAGVTVPTLRYLKRLTAPPDVEERLQHETAGRDGLPAGG
jgi:GNAT superfamily N-acetyltransferase